MTVPLPFPSGTAPRAEEAPRLEVRNLSLRFGRTLALEDAALRLAAGEIVAVLGESGCGKSSLLRLVAGLEAPSGGEIRIDGRLVAGPGRLVPPEARGVGLMFQDHALFPHLSVLDNVRFGLHRRPRAEARATALARLGEVGLAHRSDDYPHTLSGGQAQRVALARALAPEPRLLLLDEPFSGLDARTRARVRTETLALLRANGASAVLVTHDPAEALDFADRIVLMRAGRTEQAGTGQELYERPVSPFAARALGDLVEIEAQARDGRIETPLGILPAPAALAPGPVLVCLRPEALRIRPAGEETPGPGGVPHNAAVLRRVAAGGGVRLLLAVEGLAAPVALTVAPTATATAGAPLAAGATLALGLVEDRALVFAAPVRTARSIPTDGEPR